MINKIPLRFQKAHYFALAGFLLGQIIPFISAGVSGKTIQIGCSTIQNYAGNCYSIIPTNEYEWGGFTGRTIVWVIGFLILYWWEIGRKK